MDQRVTEYETWADLKRYCVLSADPSAASCSACSAARRRRARRRESDDVCTGLQLVNFLQDVPRDLELGRVYLPAEDRARFGEPALDRPSDELRALLRFEAERAAALLARGRRAARAHRRARSAARSGSSRAAGSRRSRRSRLANWDVFTQRPHPSRARLAREPRW